MNLDPRIAVYLVPLLIGLLYYLYNRRRGEQRSASIKRDALQAGLTEPASLHPIIDPLRCIGCGACVAACPEKQVLGLINRKSELINPTHCIGHGACKRACPADAITLVFGTEKRGMDIPNLTPDFETNVPGLFIAGELGGMGLIRNAIEQGKQAMQHIAKRAASGGDGQQLDVLIVGAGPSGLSASLGAKERNLKFATIEQDSLGGTVAHFPRGKIVMTAPVDLPLYGKVKLTETTKEALLELWHDVVNTTDLEISFNERLEAITPAQDGFDVKTSRGGYRARSVLLALGRRGTPRKLGAPGEELSKVVYRLIDAAQYRGQAVLVVGGGDSALEAAVSIAAEPGTTVTVSYRSAAFSRAKEKNRQQIQQAESTGRIELFMESNVAEITPADVTLEQKGSHHTIKNDAVIVCAGGVLPTPFLKKIGIEVETKHGHA
ncbi:MAG: NAD(P)-binding domain-containing protein [Gammaproteobacteria bacterium]|nr:NAD(P)-binding domain-containing protein [Gammaproteobacteria bacterium]